MHSCNQQAFFEDRRIVSAFEKQCLLDIEADIKQLIAPVFSVTRKSAEYHESTWYGWQGHRAQHIRVFRK